MAASPRGSGGGGCAGSWAVAGEMRHKAQSQSVTCGTDTDHRCSEAEPAYDTIAIKLCWRTMSDIA